MINSDQLEQNGLMRYEHRNSDHHMVLHVTTSELRPLLAFLLTPVEKVLNYHPGIIHI